MADISITDQVNLTASVQLSDDSPLALANLKTIKFSSLPIISDFNQPIDQFPLAEVELGIGLNAPTALLGSDVKLATGGGVDGTFSVCTSKRKQLFDDDEFAPAIEIKQGECWSGLCIAFNLKAKAATPPTGFGVSIGAEAAVSLGTYLQFPRAGSALPTLKDGLALTLQSYSLPSTPEMIRAIPLGVAHTAETSGSISLGAFYAAPLAVNPFATLGLPLNLSLSVGPAIEAMVKGSIELKGSFIVRTYRSSASKLIFGAYKLRETSLTASLTTSAGITADVDKTDILSKVLDAVLPAANLNVGQLDEAQKKELSKALKECVDNSISLALNATCTASLTDEAAVVYELDLSRNPAETDNAIAGALHGDWSLFETLPNARRLRNIVRDLHERKHKLTINLLGLYNASSITDYLQSTTVLHDEHGQISMVDKATAQSLSAGTTPYAAKSDKLRSALAQAFVATAAYGAAKGKLGVTSFTLRQTFLDYHAKASASDITPQILLARAVKLPFDAAWDAIPKFNGFFNQDKLYLSIGYDLQSVLRLFYQDVNDRQPYSPAALDRIGRDTRIALLDPSASSSMQRRSALTDDNIWNAMTESGDPANFRFIPGLAKLQPPALAAISADFLDIRWWTEAMSSLTPRLTAVLSAIDQSKTSDPLSDPAFMSAHKDLEKALGDLARNTRSAFGDGWPLAVMFNVAISTNGAAPSVQIDIGWNGKFEHYETGLKIAVGQSSGA
jgi:hypothetical protein